MEARRLDGISQTQMEAAVHREDADDVIARVTSRSTDESARNGLADVRSDTTTFTGLSNGPVPPGKLGV